MRARSRVTIAAAVASAALFGCPGSNPMTPDAGTGGGVDGGTGNESDGGDRCTSQCECPAGTLCTIDGMCAGSPTVAACAADGGCPCGRSCVDGFCPPFVGSMRPCSHSCECFNETCAAGHCVAAENSAAGSCRTNTDCDGCPGTICLAPEEPQFCAQPDQCETHVHCLLYSGAGYRCDCVPDAGFECPADWSVLPPEPVFGHCELIDGQQFAGNAFTAPASPSGLCSASEKTTVTVANVTGATGMTVYAASGGSGSTPYFFNLLSPGGVSMSLTLGMNQVQLSDLAAPAQVNGTWTLCAYANTGAQPLTVGTWRLYFR
jgi:hypothetical protein